MTEEQMREYMLNGGRLFTINAVQTVRDGGTKVLQTMQGDKFYINKDSKKFHSSWPTSDENTITDPLLIAYLIERIQTYILRAAEDVERSKNLLVEVLKQHEAV